METQMPKETVLAFYVAKTHYGVKSYLDAAMRRNDCDLTPPESYLLRFIYENERENGIPFSFLQSKAKASKGTISECLSSLGRKKMIECFVDPTDRRRKSFGILPKGIEAIKTNHRVLYEAHEYLTQGISKEDLETYVRVCNQLRANAIKGLETYNEEDKDE